MALDATKCEQKEIIRQQRKVEKFEQNLDHAQEGIEVMNDLTGCIAMGKDLSKMASIAGRQATVRGGIKAVGSAVAKDAIEGFAPPTKPVEIAENLAEEAVAGMQRQMNQQRARERAEDCAARIASGRGVEGDAECAAGYDSD